ncbi:NADPH:quinone oxidoreductase-like isoform X2 [Syzygium oleosum]|uniref:NADPH:quinone oxidoreductase-like isoform X2 n=1 Tax=Syzygium oleosum TaxID=219896 RepID=UPI0024BAB758|nr:NADPH:quinone oxidoreductase-like isoform X2 [Syzygium oleosum]
MESTVVASPMIKVAAICGSIRKASSNRGLLRSAIEICEESVKGMQIELIDVSSLPMINTDLEVDGRFPLAVEAFRQKVLILLFAMLAPLKNAIDWASRPPNVWAGKAAAVVSSAGGSGGRRVQNHLRQIGVFVDLHFINKPEFNLNGHEPPKKFDRDGNLNDPETKEKLKDVLQALHGFTLRLQGR